MVEAYRARRSIFVVCGNSSSWRIRRRPSQGTATPRKSKMSAKSQCITLDENTFARAGQAELLLTLADAPPYRFYFFIASENEDSGSRWRRPRARAGLEAAAIAGGRKDLVRARKWRDCERRGMPGARFERCEGHRRLGGQARRRSHDRGPGIAARAGCGG